MPVRSDVFSRTSAGYGGRAAQKSDGCIAATEQTYFTAEITALRSQRRSCLTAWEGSKKVNDTAAFLRICISHGVPEGMRKPEGLGSLKMSVNRGRG